MRCSGLQEQCIRENYDVVGNKCVWMDDSTVALGHSENRSREMLL